ncbi:MAG TPA: ATP-binding protein [Candidatus Ozemobacteraceae bacterium]|nr:ATP-binding protein [Candidatus Ozemobacteraceae bacterium]
MRYSKALLLSSIALMLLPVASRLCAEPRLVRIGIYQNEPKVFSTEAGAPAGIFVDLIQEIARRESLSLEFVPGSWVEGLRRLASGEIDLMPDVAISPDREKLYMFHREPVMSSWGQVYARPGAGIKSILDLKSRRLSVLEDSIQQQAFEQLAIGFDLKPTIVPMPNYEKVFEAVARGETDAAISNSLYGKTHFRSYGLEDTAVLFQPSALFFAAQAGRNRDLLSAIDAHLKSLKADPGSIYHRSMRRWANEETPIRMPRWVAPAVGIAVAGLLLSMLGSMYLRRQVRLRTAELKQSNDHLVAIDRLLRSTTTQLDLDAIIDTAIKGVLGLSTMDAGVLCLMNREHAILEVRACVNPPPGLAESLSGNPLRLGEGLIGIAAEGTEPYIVEHHASDHPLVSREAFRNGGITLFAGFPLRAGNDTVGVLCLFSRSMTRLEPIVRTIVRDICGPLALSIENARLYGEVKRHTEHLEQRVEQRTTELREALGRAQEADRIKSAFLATMSHELRTPLNSIIGFTGIILQELAGPLTTEQRKQLKMVQTSSRHLLALINDVLDLSKIEAGQLKLARSHVSPKESVEKIVRMVLPEAERKGIALQTRLAADGIDLYTDPFRFEQILLNLVNNAVKYSDHGQVLVECAPEAGERLRVTVTDTGIGIRTDELKKIFQPFFQSDMGTTRKYEGTGLGLSITKRLLDIMGGTIAVASEHGKGSAFTVTLPREPKEESCPQRC